MGYGNLLATGALRKSHNFLDPQFVTIVTQPVLQVLSNF